MSRVAETAYYSLRRMPPYQGTVQLIEAGSCRAVSNDGLNWQLQIRTPGTRRIIQAVWRRGDTGFIGNEVARPIVEALENAPPTPFPMRDNVELWLLGDDGLPLALLRTVTINPPLHIAETVWKPGMGTGGPFHSRGLATASAGSSVTASQVLARIVRAASGARPRSQWFWRWPDGNGWGLGGQGLLPGEEGRELDAELFPELLLRERWENESHAQLVSEYHDWLAPGLLTHSNLSGATRARLERAAARQAERFYAVRQLLPEVVNRDLVDAAFVEAVLRQSTRS